ncbi:MAG: TetR/AcrR family transcriptional regulator [Polyangia bacterium]
MTGGRAAKAAIRREQVLAAALELFCEHGYAGTSTKRIAEKAGVTEGLVFHYFGTKDALLIEVSSRQHTFAGRILTLVRQAGGGTARALLHAMAAGFSDISADEASLVGFLLAEAHVNPSLRAQIASATAVIVEGIAKQLASRVTAGELRADAPPAFAIQGFLGGFLFFFTQHRHLGEAAWRREAALFAEAWAEQCWRGLATPAALAAEKLSDHSTSSTPSQTQTQPQTKARKTG